MMGVALRGAGVLEDGCQDSNCLAPLHISQDLLPQGPRPTPGPRSPQEAWGLGRMGSRLWLLLWPGSPRGWALFVSPAQGGALRPQGQGHPGCKAT